MAISDKLQDLIDIKQDIKTAIENKGVDLTGGGSQGETWLINEYASSSFNLETYTINFISNNINYTSFSVGNEIIRYDNTDVYFSATFPPPPYIGWADQAYQTITFETAPTGDLLTWLENNAVKQTGGGSQGVAFAGYAEKIDELPAVVELTQAQYDALSPSETWVINETPVFTTLNGELLVEINFVSNSKEFVEILLSPAPTGKFVGPDNISYLPPIISGGSNIYYSNGWDNEVYRTITFETAPTGDLLTWLEANAVKQTDGDGYDNNTYYLIVEE